MNSALNQSPLLGLSLQPEALGWMIRLSKLRFGTLLARKGECFFSFALLSIVFVVLELGCLFWLSLPMM